MNRVFKILMVFVFFGVPIGITIFLVGGFMLLSYNQSSPIFNGIAAGFANLPLALIIGSIVGIPLAILNALVFIFATKTSLGKRNLIATGIFSGAFILIVIFSASYLYHVGYHGMESKQTDPRFPIMLWLICSSGMTGAILAKILKSKFN